MFETVIPARYYKTVSDVDYGLIAIVSMGALYLVGVLIKTLYYTCCHPSKLQKQGCVFLIEIFGVFPEVLNIVLDF